MFKGILRYILSFGLLFLVGFYVHDRILASAVKTLEFSLFDVYSINAIFSFGICALLLALSFLPQFADQIGFLYLGGFLLKFFVFAAVFRGVILGENALSVTDSTSLLVPIILFLALEVYFVAKILKELDTGQK